MELDLDEVEVLAHDVNKLIVVLQFYCKQNEIDQFVDEIMPLVKVLSKISDDLYCKVLSAKHPEMFDD